MTSTIVPSLKNILRVSLNDLTKKSIKQVFVHVNFDDINPAEVKENVDIDVQNKHS